MLTYESDSFEDSKKKNDCLSRRNAVGSTVSVTLYQYSLTIINIIESNETFANATAIRFRTASIDIKNL